MDRQLIRAYQAKRWHRGYELNKGKLIALSETLIEESKLEQSKVSNWETENITDNETTPARPSSTFSEPYFKVCRVKSRTRSQLSRHKLIDGGNETSSSIEPDIHQE